MLKTLTPVTGTQSAVEYEKTVTDLVNYMNYMASRARHERRQIGLYVLMLLGILFVLVVCAEERNTGRTSLNTASASL